MNPVITFVAMEFIATVHGEPYVVTPLSATSYLVSGKQAEYIIYKALRWRCADEIAPELLSGLSAAIEQNVPVRAR